MASKSEINVTSRFSHEFTTNITVNDITYLVQTEDMGIKTCKIITNIFLKGEIVFTRKSDYVHLTKLKNYQLRLAPLMEKQHKAAINQFIEETTIKQKLRPEYFEEVQQLLKIGDGEKALSTLRHALAMFPADPFLLSYYGCLIAVVENNPREGVKICRNALNLLNTSMPFGSEFYYPVFYLNLGRAYLKDKKKKDAVEAFQEGLRHDPDNRDIKWELKKLGARKPAPLPFLARGNPINKYIGKLLYKPAGK